MSTPLDRTAVAGPISADLWLSSTAPDTDIQVTISEVRPDGSEMLVTTGVQRASQRAIARVGGGASTGIDAGASVGAALSHDRRAIMAQAASMIALAVIAMIMIVVSSSLFGGVEELTDRERAAGDTDTGSPALGVADPPVTAVPAPTVTAVDDRPLSEQECRQHVANGIHDSLYDDCIQAFGDLEADKCSAGATGTRSNRYWRATEPDETSQVERTHTYEPSPLVGEVLLPN